jgi:hypothetical protein
MAYELIATAIAVNATNIPYSDQYSVCAVIAGSTGHAILAKPLTFVPNKGFTNKSLVLMHPIIMHPSVRANTLHCCISLVCVP